MPLLPPTGLTVTPTSSPPWAIRLGGTGLDYGTAVAIDTNGDVVFAGLFQGTVDFGGGPLISVGGTDAFIAKYSAAGAHIWSKRVGAGGDDIIRCIALDDDSNIIVGGTIGTDFLAKYSPDGDPIWSVGPGGPSVSSIAVDSEGNVAVTGTFQGTADFGERNLSSHFSSTDAFLAKYSPAGVNLWAINFFNYGSTEYGRAVAVGEDDSIYLAGYAIGSINLGGEDFFQSSYVAKFNTEGEHVWSRSCGNNRVYALALDSNDDVVIAGDFRTSTNPGGGTINGTSTLLDCFVAKYSGVNGAFVWAKPIIGDFDIRPTAIKADSQNAFLLTGNFRGTYNFGNGHSLTPTGPFDVSDGFVAKLSSAGTTVWAQKFGGTSSESSNAIAVDTSGLPVITGSFYGAGTFGAQTLTSAGDSDVFLYRICRMENSITWSPPANQMAGNMIPITTWPDASIEPYVVQVAPGKMYYVSCGANEVCTIFEGPEQTPRLISFNESGSFVPTTPEVQFAWQPFQPVTAILTEHGDQTYRLYRNRDIIREIPASELAERLPVVDSYLTELTFYTYRVDAIDTGGGIASSPLAAAITSECTPTGYPIQFGGLTGDRPNAATIDSSGNVYICGGLFGMLSPMLFVAKLNSSAAFVWVKYYPFTIPQPSSGSTLITSITVDASGNVYIAGQFNGTLNLGDGWIQGNSNGKQTSFMAKLNSSGVLQFKVTKVGEVNYRTHVSLSSGNIFIAGTYEDFGGFWGTRGFVDKYNSSGVLQWATILGVEDNSTANSACNGLAIDSNGDVHVVGKTHFGILNICGQSINTGSATNVILTKLSGVDGSCVWVRNHGLTGSFESTSGEALALDSQGNHLIAGLYSFGGTAGGAPLAQGSGQGSPFIAKYDSSGNHLWSQGIPTATAAGPIGMLVGDNDAAFIIGASAAGRFYFPGHTVNVPLPAGYIMKFSSAGVFASLNLYGNSITDAAIASGGRIMIVGDVDSPGKGTDNFIELLTQ